jgi:hypothetical protein
VVFTLAPFRRSARGRLDILYYHYIRWSRREARGDAPKYAEYPELAQLPRQNDECGLNLHSTTYSHVILDGEDVSLDFRQPWEFQGGISELPRGR